LKFVLDTNIFLKALIRDSVVRGIILGSNHEFLIPAYLVDETRKHQDEVERKSGLSEKEIESVMDALLAKVQIIPAGTVLSRWKEADEAMREVDAKDTPFVAAALGVNCDGIWSDDRHLKRQNKVKVWTTKDVVILRNRV
jgi:predicted nucleic acid-binding protein